MQSINLLPAGMLRRRMLIGRAKAWGVVFAAVSVVLVVGERSMAWRLTALRTAVAHDDGRVLQLAEAKVQAAGLIERQTRSRKKRAALQQLVERKGWEDVIREVTSLVGDAVWLRELRINHLHPNSRALLASGGVDDEARPKIIVKLAGSALSNTEFSSFISRLNASALLTDVRPAESRIGRLFGKTLVEFSVACTLVTDSP